MPADTKWFARGVVAVAIIDTMYLLGLNYPEVGPAKRRELITATKRALLKK